MVGSVYKADEREDEEYAAYLREHGEWYEAEYDRALLERSYVTPALIILLLYGLLWAPGLIANLIYLREANRNATVARRPPRGRGCLVALLWAGVALPVLGLAFARYWLLATNAGAPRVVTHR